MHERIKLIYEQALNFDGINSVKRCLAETCHDLDVMETKNTSITSIDNIENVCYACNKRSTSSHSVYVYMCKLCGNIYQKNRKVSANLTDHIALVIGARTKLGHQTVLKLLRAGCAVFGTTRKVDEAMNMYKNYKDSNNWIDRLYIRNLDLDTNNIQANLTPILDEIKSKYGRLNYLINIAAQTIRQREKLKCVDVRTEKNRYGDAKYADDLKQNSWQLLLNEVSQQEFEEVFRVNSIAPAIIISSCIPLLEKVLEPYIVNVHSREGLMNVRKSKHHVHLNMAKSALSMLTYNLKFCKYRTVFGTDIRIHGIDPGWISIDEYFENDLPWIVPPIDEIDGASKIVFPIFKRLPSAFHTTRHYYQYIF